jgi:hypothetical protein
MFGVFREKSALLNIVHNYRIREIGRVFVPEALSSAAEYLYHELGSAFYDAARDGTAAEKIPDTADIWYEHDAQYQSVEIYILEYGADCAARITEIEKACAQPDLTANLYIDMRSPNAPAAYEALVGGDCVYAGFMPLSETHEYVILHRAGGRPIRYDELKLTAYSERTLARLGVFYGNEQDV